MFQCNSCFAGAKSLNAWNLLKMLYKVKFNIRNITFLFFCKENPNLDPRLSVSVNKREPGSRLEEPCVLTMTSPFFLRSRWMWRIRNMSRESHVSQHERILPMYVQQRICWRRSGVCWRHSVQTWERQKTDHIDRGRSWRRSPFYHCFDSVLLLCKKTKGRGERRNHRENGIYAFWIWKWLAKFWRFRIRLKQFFKLWFKFGYCV